MDELNQSDACLVIRKAVSDVPTWVEEDSYIAQHDMRSRCELAAAEAARVVIDKFAARIVELEKRSLILQALEEVGVDNWGGYGDAQCLLDEWEAENNAS